MESKITLEELTAIYELFKYKNWPIDETNKSSLYSRFYRTYEKFDEEERNLFIKLSYQYKVVSLNDYQELLTKVLSSAVKNHLGQAQAVYVYPIKKNEHRDCVKSADLVTYLCNGTHMKYSDILSKKNFLCLGSMEQIAEKKSKIGKSRLIIIDDFIGTGNYARAVVSEIEGLGISPERIIIVSLFITKEALKRLQELDCSVEYGEMIESCLKEITSSEKEILARIEQRIGITEQYHLGYCQSGTLISLIRTPNNTIPIFWQPSGRSYAPPFQR